MAAQHENCSTVSVSKILSVYPKVLHPPKLLSLSNLDRQCPILMYLVFFYKHSHAFKDLTDHSIFSPLKTGLEETLSVWYPAAGRLSSNPDDGKLNLWCNNGGAVLVEAVTHVKISELRDLSQYNGFFENLVYKPLVNGNISEMPLVVAKVTKFGCGGYSLGVGTSHSLFDGPAAYNFLCAWASHSNTTMKGVLERPELPTPVHERGRLLLMDNNQTPKGTLNLHKNSDSVIRVRAIDHLYQLIKQAAPHDDHDQNHDQDCVLRTFHLSGAMIENLKRKVFTEKRGTFSCSSFKVVAVHLWKARTMALGFPKERMVCLQFAVDTRTRMVPPLPKGFSGNAYVLASVAMTAGELEEASYEAIVEKIEEAKNSVNNDYINAYVKALEGSPQATLPPLKELTLVSDWTRVPFHKLDFLGEEAAYASPLVTPLPQVVYFLQNPNESEGIDVRIGLFPQTLSAFSHCFLFNLQ
ncbi:brassinosteroid-related acyltransferase 1 [Cornus florida]|uniref:brassinosteroid-related acyltransferase 1 n=1 Tax=Cornus florida TaxID=4283 RepID=UPI002897481C|nr:brassinosteroid-related acyltransferase 1 [Cornus florida]